MSGPVSNLRETAGAMLALLLSWLARVSSSRRGSRSSTTASAASAVIRTWRSSPPSPARSSAATAPSSPALSRRRCRRAPGSDTPTPPRPALPRVDHLRRRPGEPCSLRVAGAPAGGPDSDVLHRWRCAPRTAFVLVGGSSTGDRRAARRTRWHPAHPRGRGRSGARTVTAGDYRPHRRNRAPRASAQDGGRCHASIGGGSTRRPTAACASRTSGHRRCRLQRGVPHAAAPRAAVPLRRRPLRSARGGPGGHRRGEPENAPSTSPTHTARRTGVSHDAAREARFTLGFTTARGR